jgi:hypothetical protein
LLIDEELFEKRAIQFKLSVSVVALA